MTEPFKTKTQLKAEQRACGGIIGLSPASTPQTAEASLPPPVKQVAGVPKITTAPVESVFLSVGKKTQRRPVRRIISSYDLPASRRPIS